MSPEPSPARPAGAPAWVEICAQVAPEAAETVADLLREEAGGLALEESGGAVRLRAYLFLEDSDEGRAQRILSRLAERLRRAQAAGLRTGGARLRVRAVAAQDWSESWKAHYGSFPLGRRFWLRPSWVDSDPPPGRREICLDPGLAFGTGLHPTTAMCVEELEREVEPGAVVVDVGTGSGILAIVAARLGAARVWAVDTDPVAVRVARENCARNGVTGPVRCRGGTWAELVPDLAGEPRPGVVVANILGPVVAALARPVAGALAPGGRYVTSGISPAQRLRVEAALAEAGFTLLRRRRQGEWWCLVARAPGGEGAACTASSSTPPG